MEISLQAILSADQERPTQPPSPYVGIQWVGIPEFQAIGTAVAQEVARVLAPQPAGIDEVLARAQKLTERKVREAGYLQR